MLPLPAGFTQDILPHSCGMLSHIICAASCCLRPKLCWRVAVQAGLQAAALAGNLLLYRTIGCSVVAQAGQAWLMFLMLVTSGHTGAHLKSPLHVDIKTVTDLSHQARPQQGACVQVAVATHSQGRTATPAQRQDPEAGSESKLDAQTPA